MQAEKPKRGRATRALFILGIISSLLGLLGNISESVPMLQMVVSPEYSRCKVGLATLQKAGKLTRGQIGCENLGNIVLERLAVDKPQSQAVNFGAIEHFTVERSIGFAFSAGGAPKGNIIRVTARFKKGDVENINFSDLQTWVDTLKTESKAQYAVFL